MATVDLESPAIRARWTQMLLDGIDVRLTEEQSLAVRARLDPASVARIRSLDELDWLDMDTHMHVLDALFWGLGKAQFVAFQRESARRIFHSRFLRTIAIAGVRVFGRSALLRAFPRGWNLVIRGCGKLEVQRDEAAGTTEITLRDIPPHIARSEAIRLATASAIAASIDIGGYLGRVEVDPGVVKNCTFVFRASLIVEPPAG